MSEYRSEIRTQVGSGMGLVSNEFMDELMLLMKYCVDAGGSTIRFKMPKIDKEEPPYCEITLTYDK